MKRVVCASRNPVKLRATRGGFARLFPHLELTVDGVSVDSGVSVQPRTSEETLHGAETRAHAARRLRSEADFWVGIEGGVDECHGRMEAMAWVVVLSPQRLGRSRSGSFLLPDPVAELIRQGMELGPADDRVFGRTDSKRKEGAVGLLTDNVVDRAALYEQAVLLALVPFKNESLYAPEGNG